MKFLKKKRFYKLKNSNIKIKDIGKIYLKNNEQVTFKFNKSEYDVCKKDWGYYATPSMNKRLKMFKFRSFLVKNKKNDIYIHLVHSNKILAFKKYLKKENNYIVKEFTNYKNSN
tara:strand:- start:266 stop:607 length:342 start_codon:yes stop_codon:yes gene_type:complete